MDSNRAVDDLKAIRQIMERTQRSVGGYGGRFMILWGIIWFFGFLGNQFLAPETLGWLWLGLTAVGTGGSIWIGVRIGRRARVHSTMWRPIVLWFLAMFVFIILIAWLFDLHTTRDIALLIVLTVSLSYVELGLITDWTISLVGVLLAAFVVAGAVLLPGYFFLVMAVLSGGLLVGTGLWFVRHEG